jgi:hypothetical protein
MRWCSALELTASCSNPLQQLLCHDSSPLSRPDVCIPDLDLYFTAKATITTALLGTIRRAKGRTNC